MSRRIVPNPIHVFVDELSAEIATENGLEVAESNLLLMIALKRNKAIVKRIAVPSGHIAIKRERSTHLSHASEGED
jgi:hypothetical protein